jgi:3-hydroxy acid dehydrogenase / malonic semialdehyde reductase
MNRTFLVTGASSGIGRHIARRLLARGHKVIGTSRTPQVFQFAHAGFSSAELDLSKADYIEGFARNLLKAHPDLNGVVFAAGFGQFGGLEQFSQAQIQRLMTVNCLAPMLLTRALIPHFKHQDNAQLIYIGSEAALQGKRNGSIYCASKFALRGFTQALRDECAKSGVRVHLINPGLVNTPFFDTLDFKPGQQPEQSLQTEDIADCVEYLLHSSRFCAIDEINLSPLNKVIDFKK